MHAVCSAVVEQLGGLSINRSVVNFSEPRHEGVRLEIIVWPVSILVGMVSNGNGFHGLMYFDIVLRYRKQPKKVKRGPLKR